MSSAGRRYDYIIVGSGIAGLYTAILARDQGSVLVITKGGIDETNTRFAQGGIAAAIGREDSPELHFRDTINAGAGLCNEEAVRILVEQAADSITDLVNLNVPFDTLDGEIALATEAAHSRPRILHAGGDTTGELIEVTLSNQAIQDRIQVLEHSLVTDIVVEGGVVSGVKVLNCHSLAQSEFSCRYLILATGGGGQLFKVNTNPGVATADGVALAYEAGAEITDIEFYQFHPTALHMEGVTPFLISEAVRGEGGILRNIDGHRFMPDYHKGGELAPRDIVSRSILAEMEKTGSDMVFIDVTHLPPSTVTTRFPNIYRFCLEQGLEITRDLIPVAPAAHYMIGGVKTNTWGETSIPGMFACGETACTGIHGANRLASNSLLEAMVFGKRIAQRTKGKASNGTPVIARKDDVYMKINSRPPTKDAPEASLEALQQLLWEKAGILRGREGLLEAAGVMAAWQEQLSQPADRPSYELRNLVTTGRLMTEAAILREESRGAHYRTDFPRRSARWKRHIVLRKE